MITDFHIDYDNEDLESLDRAIRQLRIELAVVETRRGKILQGLVDARQLKIFQDEQAKKGGSVRPESSNNR